MKCRIFTCKGNHFVKFWNLSYSNKFIINPLAAKISSVFGHFFGLVFGLLEDRVLHKETWFAMLLGTHLRIQVHKKVKFSGWDISYLAVKELKISQIFYCILNSFQFWTSLSSNIFTVNPFTPWLLKGVHSMVIKGCTLSY